MLSNRKGQRVPDATVKVRRADGWADVTTSEFFGGRRVACFALPGAFTPTCSTQQLPRYEQMAPVFKRLGVDEVVCLSVNDSFVMEAWRADQHVDGVTMLADGNGALTAGMGMLVDKSQVGLGKRSWRYSMVVNDGVVEEMFVEPEVEGDPYEVSNPETMLRYLDPGAQREDITLFTMRGCPHCARAKTMLHAHGKSFEEIELGQSVTVQSLRAVTGARTVPQVFIDGQRIGGADDLEVYLSRNAA